MRAMTKRLDALEQSRGGDHLKPWHVIIMAEDTPHVEALAEYRAKNPELAINPDDNAMWIHLVSPKLDEKGSVIALEREDATEGPSLADVLAMEAGQ